MHSIYIINLFNKTKSPNVRPETDNGDLVVVRQRHDKTKTVSIRNILLFLNPPTLFYLFGKKLSRSFKLVLLEKVSGINNTLFYLKYLNYLAPGNKVSSIQKILFVSLILPLLTCCTQQLTSVHLCEVF